VNAAGTVVAFVHGCTQGPSGWDRVRRFLEGDGTSTLAVDLEPTRFNDASALECAIHIAEVLADFEHVVLVCTSCTGIIIPVVATLTSIERLVFVCAGLPDLGRSVADQIANDGVLQSDWASWKGEPGSEEAARRFMFNDCDESTLEWSLTTVRSFVPRPAYQEVTPLASWPDVPSTYILGLQDCIISQNWARLAVPQRLGTSPLEIDTGHCPQNSQPFLLAKLLGDLVNAR
jgi:hypothetical protein